MGGIVELCRSSVKTLRDELPQSLASDGIGLLASEIVTNRPRDAYLEAHEVVSQVGDIFLSLR
jgi:hypothetical protein